MYAAKELKNDDVEVMLFLGLMKLANELYIIPTLNFCFYLSLGKISGRRKPWVLTLDLIDE